uniref:DNA-directed RNA polymerase n=1 Tax=Mesocestoides corti TaxID=53468 RepID=A0A5K3EFD0_MESCO
KSASRLLRFTQYVDRVKIAKKRTTEDRPLLSEVLSSANQSQVRRERDGGTDFDGFRGRQNLLKAALILRHRICWVSFVIETYLL